MYNAKNIEGSIYMIKNNFQNLQISALGMGCMRYPYIDNFSNIDIEASRKIINYAMSHGINYYDTAWGYHDGNSEKITGELLREYPRESYYLASKFPGYDLSNINKVEEIFEEQLKRCGVDFFDFYLFHNVCEMNINEYLDPKYRILDYLLEQKKNGRIRHLGFSTHGTLETMKKFIDACGNHMEFAQIQINWLDWNFQDAKSKVDILNKHNIPIWVMEPVRGGSLLKLSPEHADKLRSIAPNRSLAEWGFRFLQSISGVTMTLSGMSTLSQMIENISIYESSQPLNDEEKTLLLEIANEMTSKTSLPCTKCRYCTTHCPMELDIPRLIEIYNEDVYSGGGFMAPMALDAFEENKLPSACIGCKACEAVCPQNIKISDMMTDLSKRTKKE